DLEIQTARQFDHGVRLVEFGGGEELLARRAEASLRGLQHGRASFAFAGHIEQSEKETVRADPQEIVKIASGARGKISDRHVSAPERSAFPLDDFGNFLRRRVEPQLCQQPCHKARNLTQITAAEQWPGSGG